MFSAQSLFAGNGASVTCLQESREPITTLNEATYVTPLVVRNFWLCDSKSVLSITAFVINLHLRIAFFTLKVHLLVKFCP